MMTISDGISAQHAATYYKKEHGKDYYLDGHVEGTWLGRGADKLGLNGTVSIEQYKKVLDGRHPTLEVQLVRGSSAADGKRVAAWDITFAAPKSVSIMCLIGRSRDVLEAHDRAVAAALETVEQYTRGRMAGLKRGPVTSNLVIAQFKHDTSRQLDPHLHTHNVAVNLTERFDGKWVALDSPSLFEMQRLGTAIYRSVLAEQLIALGFALRHGRHGTWEIDAISDAVIAHFSQRTGVIHKQLKTNGEAANARAYKKARRATRPKKQHVERNMLEKAWDDAARSVGLDLTNLAKTNQEAQVDTRSQETKAAEAVTYAIAHITEREAVFTENDLVAAALERRAGYVDALSIRAEILHRLNHREIVPHRHSPEYLTTREMLQLERQVIDAMLRSFETVSPISTKPDLNPYDLSTEQRRTAERILGSCDRIIGIEGVAGAGKTRALGAIREIVEQSSLIVRGLAPTTGAARELEGAGVKATTVAHHLEHPGAKPNHELWIVDEAGLLATRTMLRLLEQAEQAGARLILVGDTRQHAGVEAGMPFRLLQEAGMTTVRLQEIYRQRDSPDLLRAVRAAAAGVPEESIEILEAMQAVALVEDWDARHARIAEDYAQADEGTIVIAPSNLERIDLNDKIRSVLGDRGRLRGEPLVVTTLRNRDMTKVQLTVAAQYQEGDVLHFHRGSRKHDIPSGAYATVIERNVAANSLRIQLNNGEERTYDPRRLMGVDAYVRESREFRQGDRLQFRAAFKDADIPNGTLATILILDPTGIARLHVDGRREIVELDLHTVLHVDYGFAVTSHSAQGKTVDNALIAVRTANPRLLVNQSQLYVSISRARTRVQIYTDNANDLGRAVARTADKANALDFQQTDHHVGQHQGTPA